MLTMCAGDIFQDGAFAIVNPVNCEGVMGKGLALEFKKRYPDNYAAYKFACEKNEVHPGTMFTVDGSRVVHGSIVSPQIVINFPTKDHWRDNSRIKFIQSGLVDLETVITARDIRSIAIPALGCGLGGLSWTLVKPVIVRWAQRLPHVAVNLYSPAA